MLPYFPKTHKQMMEIWNDQFWQGYYSASPVLSQIRLRPQREGKKSSVQNEQGKIQNIDYRKSSVTIRRTLEDAQGMTIMEFVQTAREPGIGMGRETMRNIYEMLDNTTKETGNIVKTGGQTITHDLFLDLLEKIQIDFTDDGLPIWPSFSGGSEAHEHFNKHWPEWILRPDFTKRLDQIVERKREEFYARQAYRRLVD